MKTKKYLNSKLVLTWFLWVVVVSVVSNPVLTPLNLTYSGSQLLTAAPTSVDGVSLQGSMIVFQLTKAVIATNSTGQPMPAYQVSVSTFNFMALLFLITPWVLFYYDARKVSKIPKTIKSLKRDHADRKVIEKDMNREEKEDG